VIANDSRLREGKVLIQGAYYFDDVPIGTKDLSSAERVEGNSAANARTIVASAAGIIYRSRDHTAVSGSSGNGDGSVVSHSGNILIWDGRLDNRTALELSLGREHLKSNGDFSLLLAAYERWGSDFLFHVVGDFALALWDHRLKTVLLARDPFGTHPLFYHTNQNRVVWSSEISVLLSLTDINLLVCDEYVAGHLASVPEPELTPYEGVYAVPPGSFVAITNRRFRKERFWRLNPNNKIRHSTDSDYEEHFRHLFREAVRCRMQVGGPVFSELSGGIDSTSIVSMADQILLDNTSPASKLETVLFVYDVSQPSDETEFIRSVEEKRGRPGHHILESEFPLLVSLSPESILIPTPSVCFAQGNMQQEKILKDNGSRVLLSGYGGDDVLWSQAAALPDLGDLFRQLSFLELHRRIKAWAKASRSSYFELLWSGALWPLLPRSFQSRCWPTPRLGDWFDSDFARRMNLHDRILGPPDVFGFSLSSSRKHSSRILYATAAVSCDPKLGKSSIEVSYPFLHRPLVEFCVAIPIEQMLRPGETRSLLRRAMRNLLPHKVLYRTDKRGPTSALHHALAREWTRLKELFVDARVCARGYLAPRALIDGLTRAKHGFNPAPLLTRVISLEIWLRSLELRCQYREPSQLSVNFWARA